MNLFLHPDNVPDDLEKLAGMVQPPCAESPKPDRMDGRADFMSALSIAARFADVFGSTKLLDGLRELYPEAVEARLPEAQARAKRGIGVDYGGGDDEFDDGDDDDDLFM
jgi:hypothetical protein